MRQTGLVDKKVAVLRAMSMITHSTDMEEFLRLAELSMPDVLGMLKELAQEGYVTKTRHGYALVEKGKVALTALMQLPIDKAFHFYLGIGQPTEISARSIKEFYNVVSTVDDGSLAFHLSRSDFENWIETTIGDVRLAREFAGLKREELKGEALRKQILLALRTRFGEEVLTRD